MKSMKYAGFKYLLFFSLLFTESTLFAQTNSDNSINVSLFGNGAIFSGSYERIFNRDRNGFTAVNFGLGYQEEFIIHFGQSPHKSPPILTTSQQISLCTGPRKNLFEIGLGLTEFPFYKKGDSVFIYPLIGYRYQPYETGVNFRFYAYVPLPYPSTVIVIPLNLSAGICF